MATIAPQFNNLSTVRYYRKQVLTKTPGLISPIAGSDSFILDYLKFTQECPEFVQHFQLDNDVAIISVQTDFMRTLFTAIDDKADDRENDSNSIKGLNNDEINERTIDINVKLQSTLSSIFNHGMITDAAHKFFHTEKLLQTCCYYEELHRWQPILISWTGKQNKETYACHFFTLFTSIAGQLKISNVDIQLSTFQFIIATVVDFSDAQRAGFQLAYQKFLTSTEYGIQLQMHEWELSSLTYQFLSADEHYSVAAGIIKGCLQHWKKSVTRVSQNHHVIPSEQRSEFHSYISDLFSTETIENFELMKELIELMFPNTRDWLNWWCKTEHAGLLFPILRSRQFEQLEGIYLSTMFNSRNIQRCRKFALSYVSKLSAPERRSFWYFARSSQGICILW